MSEPVDLSQIVKAYDIRGLVPQQLDVPAAHALGGAFAQVVALPDAASGIVVGHDMRPSSPELAQAFAQGAAANGVPVTQIGLASTDGLYYASGVLDQPGAMFTASHNPAEYNGIKLCRAGARPISLDTGLAQIRDLAQWTLERAAVHGAPAGAPAAVTQRDVLSDYAGFLRGLVDLSGIRPLRVVVDAANGMAGHTVPPVFAGLPVSIIPLYFELDGTFPHHEANPLDPANLVDLQAAVRAHGADLGLAFDGDADRCFVVDENGQPVSPSAITALVATREIAREVADGADPASVSVVYNLISSQAVPQIVAEQGARAVRTRVGHSFIKEVMATEQAVFGGEHSAHYYFRNFWYADSGMLAALHVLAALGEQEQPLSRLMARYHRFAQSGEINSTVPDAEAATQRVREWAHRQGQVSADTLDGLTLTFQGSPMWWLNLRSSNTEPLIRLNVEAADEATMGAVRDAVLAVVRSPEASGG